LDDLRLVVSELVTNSLRHAGVRVGAPITLRVEVSSNRARVEVMDDGRGFTPAPFVEADGHGWGLSIVDRLADEWGADQIPDARVWAEFALPAR